MNPEQGLAQGMVQPTADEKMMRDLDQVVQMLMQGRSPEELVQMGVPEELIMAAIDMLSKQAKEPQLPPEQEGLAGMHLQQGM